VNFPGPVRSSTASDDALDAELQAEGLSLRVVVKEIPPVFGDFFPDSRSQVTS
jgi:hypothetical protein